MSLITVDESNYTLLAQSSWRGVKPLAQTPFAIYIEFVFFRPTVAVKNIFAISPSLQDMIRST